MINCQLDIYIKWELYMYMYICSLSPYYNYYFHFPYRKRLELMKFFFVYLLKFSQHAGSYILKSTCFKYILWRTVIFYSDRPSSVVLALDTCTFKPPCNELRHSVWPGVFDCLFWWGFFVIATDLKPLNRISWNFVVGKDILWRCACINSVFFLS